MTEDILNIKIHNNKKAKTFVDLIPNRWYMPYFGFYNDNSYNNHIYNDMVYMAEDIVNKYNKELKVSLLGTVTDFAPYVDGDLKMCLSKKNVSELVKCNPILERLYLFSTKYKLFNIIYDCIYFTPCHKLANNDISEVSDEEIYQTKFEEERPIIDIRKNHRDKMFDNDFIDEKQCDYNCGTYPSNEDHDYVVHINVRISNFKYFSNAVKSEKIGTEFNTLIAWLYMTQEAMAEQRKKDISYYNTYKFMYADNMCSFSYKDNDGEDNMFLVNFPITAEWWEKTYRAMKIALDERREWEAEKRRQEEELRARQEREDRGIEFLWRMHRLEGTIEYETKLANIGKRMTPYYVLSPEEYIEESLYYIDEVTRTVLNGRGRLAKDGKHTDYKKSEFLTNAHNYAVSPLNKAKLCQDAKIFNVTDDSVFENEKIEKKELARYYDSKQYDSIKAEKNPFNLDYDEKSLYYYEAENNISQNDLDEFDAIIQEIDDFTNALEVQELKDICDVSKIKDDAIYVETVPYNFDEIADDSDFGISSDNESNENNDVLINKSPSEVLYGREITDNDKYLLNTSIYKELLRIANSFIYNLDSIIDTYYNTNENVMYIKMPRYFVRKHIYTLYNKKFNIINKDKYYREAIVKSDVNSNIVYRCNVYNPYQPRKDTVKAIDLHGIGDDDGYG